MKDKADMEPSLPDDRGRLIEDDLAASIAELRVSTPEIETWPYLEILSAAMRVMFDANSSIAKLQARFNADESFGLLRNGYFADDLSASPIVSGMVVPALIAAAIKGADPSAVIAEARAFAETKASAARTYYAVGGVSVSARVALTPTVNLLPWVDMPASSAKSKLSKPAPEEVPSGPSPDAVAPPLAYPGCAVEIDPGWEYKLLSYGYRGLGPPETDARHERVKRNQQTAEDAVRCLFLLTVRPTAIVAQWDVAIDPVAARHRGSYLSYGSALFEPALGNAAGITANAEAVLTLWNAFLNLRGEDQEVLRRAIDRLCWAKRRPALVDQAIDLGIALEMVLLHGISDKGELSYRLALRGASFVDAPGEERLRDYRLLKEVYRLRSKAVHEGQFDRRTQPGDAANTIDAGVTLGVRVIRKIIEAGRFPDNWEEELLYVPRDH